jgi:P4 family phage/plasmid primase-like protien
VNSIFLNNAPSYWVRNIPVIALRPREKVPALMNWAIYAAQMPSQEEQERWLAGYPDGNIGLPLGPQSGMVALDLDSEDPRVLSMLLKLMPPQLWKRVGKKGAVFAFKYNGERTYRIKDENNKTIFELLSRGAQVVLPPSIHPDTQMPYVANCDLLDVIDHLPCLPPDFEVKARQALIDMGFKLTSRGATKIAEWVPAGGRDSAMVAHAGLLARCVMRGERTLMEAMNEIEVWVINYTEMVVGDPLDPAKARQKVMEFVRRDIVETNKVLPPNWAVGLSPDGKAEMRKYFGEEVEEYTRAQLMDHIMERFSAIPSDSVVDRRAVVDEVLMRISKSPSMDHLDVEMVLSYISSASGRLVALTALRRRLKELQSTGIKGEDHTEIAEALIKELEREGEVRFHDGRFHRWAGSHWSPMPPTEMRRKLASEFGRYPAARRQSDHKGILKIAADLASAILASSDIAGINFANGYLTRDLELLGHDPKYGAIHVLPYRYVPDAGPPELFMSLLVDAWGGDEDFAEKVQALREAIAVTLFGLTTKFSRVICLQGIPHSGKSVVLRVLRGLVPPASVCDVPPHDWGKRFVPTQMLDRLVNFCGELSDTDLIASALFKGVVEGDEMLGEFKGQDHFKFKPMCAHWFASNHLPRSRDTSAGFTRRWLFLKFNRAFPVGQRSVDFHDEILAEDRESIVAWAAPAIREVLARQEYTLPASHHELVADVASLNNSVRHFLRSGPVRRGPGLRASEPELYSLYYRFCRMTARSEPFSLSRFRGVMQDLMAEFSIVLREPDQASSGPSYFAGIAAELRRA